MPFDALPPELYSAILDSIDDEAIQPTVLALTRAIPHLPIFLERFFRNIRLCSPEKVVQLHRRLRGGMPEAQYVRDIRIESWTADAQVVINLLSLLEKLTSLALFVGPNFAPENLLEIFERPWEGLESLSLRFRPYVHRANYYHFLKGAYFDPTMTAIANWPSSSLRSLSVVQDPFVEQVSFAQPLVFFKFQPFSSLSISLAARNITALRICVPSRDVVPFLTVAPEAFPSLCTLDLSTGNVKSAQLARLLMRFDRVQHMCLDACALLIKLETEEWVTLGKDCALTGVRRAREREKALKAWRELQEREIHPMREQAAAGINRNRARTGRKGLASATISLRGAGEPALPTPTSVPAFNGPASAHSIDPAILDRKIRIVPLPPSLLTLSAPAPTPIPPSLFIPPHGILEIITACRNEFMEGWEAGIGQLRSTWTRLRASAKLNRGVVVMALRPGASPEAAGLDGLEEVDEERWKMLEDGKYPPPVLCLAGEHKGGEFGQLHVDGCGHRVTENMWGDPSFLWTR